MLALISQKKKTIPMDENNVKLRNCFVEETSKGKVWSRGAGLLSRLPQGFRYKQLHLTLAIPYLTIP